MAMSIAPATMPMMIHAQIGRGQSPQSPGHVPQSSPSASSQTPSPHTETGNG